MLSFRLQRYILLFEATNILVFFIYSSDILYRMVIAKNSFSIYYIKVELYCLFT